MPRTGPALSCEGAYAERALLCQPEKSGAAAAPVQKAVGRSPRDAVPPAAQDGWQDVRRILRGITGVARYNKPTGGKTGGAAGGVWRADPRGASPPAGKGPASGQFKKSNAKPRSAPAAARKTFDKAAFADKPFGDKPAAPRRGAGRAERAPRVAANIALIYGYHSVREALRSERRELVRLYATEAAAQKLGEEIAARALEVNIVEAAEIARRLSADAVHQGLLLEARHLEPIAVADIPDNGLVLVLDQISDPHNVGAIVRTAAAFGVDAIVTTERHSPEFTGVLAKSASGGLEHVAIASIVNLARALEELGDRGFVRIGLDSEGENSLADLPLQRPLALVLGAEGKGLRRLSRENCDTLARLDMPGKIKSLNVSNACAVALALVTRRLA